MRGGSKCRLTAEVGGVRMTLKEISERYGVSYTRVYKWYSKGQDISEMLDIRNGLRPNPRRYADLTGQRFGRLTAIEPAGTRQTSGVKSMFWRCVCDCGKETVVPASNLRSGGTRSCGCLRSQSSKERAKAYFSGPRIYLDIDGERMSIDEMSKRYGVTVRTIRLWRKSGKDLSEAVREYVERKERRVTKKTYSCPRLTGVIWRRRS